MARAHVYELFVIGPLAVNGRLVHKNGNVNTSHQQLLFIDRSGPP